MPNRNRNVLLYRRSHFATQLPMAYRYSPAHVWVAHREGNLYRLGLTKFATRMLGEMVDHGFEVQPGRAVALGEIVGWIEGFKAISDLYCVVQGEFCGGNPELLERISLVNQDPYGAGWLYEVRGEPDRQCLEVDAYRDLLDKTIDRLLSQRQAQAPGDSVKPEPESP